MPIIRCKILLDKSNSRAAPSKLYLDRPMTDQERALIAYGEILEWLIAERKSDSSAVYRQLAPARGIHFGAHNLRRPKTAQRSALDCAPRSASYQSVDEQHDDSSDDGADESSAFFGPIPAESLTKIRRHECPHNSQYRSQDKT